MDETVESRIARLGLTEISPTRLETLTTAHPLVSDEVFCVLGNALRVSRTPAIILPSHRYEQLSRGRGWARQGTGSSVVWGERVDGGYCVGPGKWVVGATDGFSRKASESWVVKHVRVGDAMWTVAS